MASTRNINSTRDYSCQQRIFNDINNYNTFENSAYGVAHQTNLPDLGFNGASIPREKLSNNAIDIESQLFGIGSTNLVTPKTPVLPDLNCIQHKKIIDKVPFVMPNPLVIEKNQRPRPKN
tara:strand:- start:5 stop:364 length:360 start_codon:yes stop_codon:yes gene_type:complete